MSIDDERFRRDEELLRHALRQEADGVLPSLDALSRIRRRTARPPLWRRPVVLGMAAASVTAVAVITASTYVLGDSSDDTTTTGSESSPSPTAVQTPSPSVTGSPSPEPTETIPAPPTTRDPEPESKSVPVYYFVETPRGARLVREFHSVPVPEGPIVAAVQTMLSERALDPEYQTYWQADTEVQSVEVRDDVIDVDFTGETDYTGVREDVAQVAVQQLVHTVTAAASVAGQNGELPVQILVDGQPPDAMWGQLDLSDPVPRAPQLDILSPVQIHTPQDGDVVGRSVTVDGVAVSFEGHLDWQIFDDQGNVVDSGFTQTTDSSRLAPFTFTVELQPGIYSVVVIESDPTGGTEGTGPTSDTKNFTVK